MEKFNNYLPSFADDPQVQTILNAHAKLSIGPWTKDRMPELEQFVLLPLDNIYICYMFKNVSKTKMGRKYLSVYTTCLKRPAYRIDFDGYVYISGKKKYSLITVDLVNFFSMEV